MVAGLTRQLAQARLFGTHWLRFAGITFGGGLLILTIPLAMDSNLYVDWAFWWGFAVGLGAWAFGLGVVARWPPRVRARQDGATRTLRIAPWRRIGIAALGAAPILAIGLRSHWGPAGGLMALVAGGIGCVGFLEEFTFDDAGIRWSLLGLKRTCSWTDIIGVDARPPGITLLVRDAKPFHIRGVLFDGYPAFVGALFDRVPRVVRDNPDAVRVLEPIRELDGNG